MRKVKRSKKREEGTTKKIPNVKWRGEAHAQHVLPLSGDPGEKITQVFPNTKKEGKCPEKSFHTCSKFVRNLFGKFVREKERKGEKKVLRPKDKGGRFPPEEEEENLGLFLGSEEEGGIFVGIQGSNC